MAGLLFLVFLLLLRLLADRRRVFAFELEPVLLSKLLLQPRVTLETLRLGPVVQVAPVAFLLALLGEFDAAHAALVFRDAVLVAPPAAVVVDFLRGLSDAFRF